MNVAISPTTVTAAVASAAAGQVLPTLNACSYISPPVLTWSSRRIRISFFLGRGEFASPDLGYQIWPPTLLVSYDALRVRFLELRAITPLSFGLNHPNDRPLGGGRSPGDKLQSEYLEARLRLIDASDALITDLVNQQPYEVNAAAYKQAFATCLDGVLTPYASQMIRY